MDPRLREHFGFWGATVTRDSGAETLARLRGIRSVAAPLRRRQAQPPARQAAGAESVRPSGMAEGLAPPNL